MRQVMPCLLSQGARGAVAADQAGQEVEGRGISRPSPLQRKAGAQGTHDTG